MPRFYRGGRGLYRKIMSTNGIDHTANNNMDRADKNVTVPTPRLDKIFKWLSILTVIILVGSFIIAMCARDYLQIYTTCLMTTAGCFVLLLLELLVYVSIYKMICLRKEQEETEIDANKINGIPVTKSNRELFLSSANKQKINEFTEKYYLPISNFAKQRHSCDKYGFCYILWRNTNWSMAGNDFYVMEENNTILSRIIEDDWGARQIERNKYRGYFYPDTLFQNSEQLTFLLKSLKEKIKGNAEWADTNTFEIALYFIIRNGLIKYYKLEFEKTYCYKTIDDVAKAIISCHYPEEKRHIKYLYIYYYAYTHDLFAPLKSLKDTLLDKIDKTAEELKYNEYASKLYIQNTVTKEEATPLPSLSDNEIRGISFNSDAIESIATIEKIDRMSGRQFEEFIADFFKKKGYRTSLTPESGDYGIDVIVESAFFKIGIQTKCYNDKVSNSAVQEAVTGIRHYNLDKAMVITNSYFQPSAITLAKDNNVILLDRDKLIEEIEKMEK